MEIISNHIKALLFLEDITEGISVSQTDCFTVQHFNYCCYRKLDALNEPVGQTDTALLRFTIKALPDGGGKSFYQRLIDNESSVFSFVFNATFDSSRRLQDYDDAMVASGYVVHVSEVFGKAEPFTKTDKVDGMMMRVEVLLSSITYIGKSSNKMLVISNN